jgi:MFS family permease
VKASGSGFDRIVVKHARFAVSAGFFMFGLALAVWAVHIPAVTARLQLDPAVLGFALLNIGLGAIVTQPLAGSLVARTGSRSAAAVFLPVFLAASVVPILAWSTSALFVGTLVLGSALGANVVALNTQASEVEQARGRPTMSSIHGFFSLGALVGAILGAAIIALNWQDGRGAILVACVQIVAAIVAARFLLAKAPPAPAAEQADASVRGPLGGALPALAALACFPTAAEGIVNNWSALYLSTVRDMSEATATSGFALFSLGMAACRLGGGPLVDRLGEKRIILFGGLLVALGIGLVVLPPWKVICPLGFGLVAVGAANMIPVMMSVASRAPGVAPSAGVAIVGIGAAAGFLIGPPVIGFIAQGAGLGLALGCLGIAGLAAAAGAAAYPWPSTSGRP